MATQPRLVNKQFNSPINLYSDQNVKEVLQRESQMLGNGAVGINFYNPSVGKPTNLQNSAVLRMLEEEENRQRNGQLSTKRVAWPPPREGEEFDEQAAVQSQGGTQSSSTPGLQNNFSSGRQSVSPAPQTRVPLKPLDISSTTSSISYQQSLKSPVQNQSPIGFRPQTPTRQWAPVQSPVTTHPPQIQTMQQYNNQIPQQYQQQQTYKQTHQTYQQTQQYQRQYETSQQQYQPASYHYESSQEYHTTQNNQTPQVKYQSTQQQVQSQYRQQYQPPQQQNQTPQQQYQPPQQQYQPPQQQYQPPQQQYQPTQQQYQPPQQQYQPPQQQYQPPQQQYQPPQQQYQPPQPSQQYQPPQQPQPPQQQYQPPQQNHYQPQQQYATPQQQPQSPQQYQTTPSQPPTQQVFAKPGAASSQAPNQYKPVKNVEPPPSTITLRPQPPVSQAPPPVFSSQPATATLKGGKHLRGDLKWPPENVKKQMEEEHRQRIELAKGPAVRPKKVMKDYTPFFEQHALNSSYPGYKIPPGTQFYRPV